MSSRPRTGANSGRTWCSIYCWGSPTSWANPERSEFCASSDSDSDYGARSKKKKKPRVSGDETSEVFVRPALGGKRLPGEVEIHQKGLRYQSPMGSQKISRLTVDGMNADRLIMHLQTYYSQTSNTCSFNHVTKSCS